MAAPGVAGDFNQAPRSLLEVRQWEECGWVEIQTHACMHWGWEPRPTRKGATRRDLIYVSPELAALCVGVSVENMFADHALAKAQFQAPCAKLSKAWVLPSLLPWNEIDVASWHEAPCSATPVAQASTDWYRAFAKNFEASVADHVRTGSGSVLPCSCLGRASHTQPRQQAAASSLAKPSRAGEVSLASDLVGHEVLLWFKQLRRIQSLVHSLKSNKQDPNACVYRAELWHKIRSCRAFKGGFHVWWQTRRIQLQGSPSLLPPAVLRLEGIQRVYEDFHANPKSFEAWNGRARRDALQHRHQQGREQVFRELRKDRSQTVDSLQFHHTHIVSDVDPDSHQVFLEEPVDFRGHSSWQLEGQPCRVTEADGQLCQVVSSERPMVGQELIQHQIITSTADIQAEFARHWAAKWQKHAGVEVDFWQRALDFCNAYLPACSFDLPPLNIKTWNKALQRYKPFAAKGVDGFAKSDLVNMPPTMKQELISFLSRIESGEADWPAQMLIGLIMNLDKENGKEGVHAFRPICVLSIVFRTWSSIRTRQLLRQISGAIARGAYGYLPMRESKEVWLSTQASIERALLRQEDLLGFSTDLVAAFNTLPRAPVFLAASRIGIPDFLIHAWDRFLGGLSRSFVVHGEAGEQILSSTGFPEGDPMSMVAMTIIDWAWHLYYLHQFL